MGVVFCNNEIDAVKYSGYTIDKIYACGGVLVYEATPPITTSKVDYTLSGVTHSIPCNSSSVLSRSEIVNDLSNSADTSAITSVIIGDCVTNIGNSAFNNYRSLTSIDIPNSVTSIGQQSFYDCTSLTSCTIGNGVTTIGTYAFRNCTSLTSITITATRPPMIGSSVFSYTNDCPIYVPCESVSAYKTEWSTYASRIQECVKWKATYTGGSVSSASCDSSTTISENDIDVTNLASLEIGDCVTELGTRALRNSASLTSCTLGNSVEVLGNYSLANCSELTSITLPQSLTTLSGNVFSNCSGLTSIDIPNSVTYIGAYTFYKCYGLTSCTIGSGVTSVGQHAFNSCSGLTSLTLPSTVTEIGAYAFRYCSGLTSFTCLATTPPTLGNNLIFDGASNCPIYVPSGSVNAYKTADKWSDFSSRIQAIA